MRDLRPVATMIAALAIGGCKDKAPVSQAPESDDAAMVALDPEPTTPPVPLAVLPLPSASAPGYGTLAPAPSSGEAPWWLSIGNGSDGSTISLDASLATAAPALPLAAEPPPSDPGAQVAAAATSGPPIKRTVLPSSTDPNIQNPNDPHVVVLPGGARNGKLLVFLPGTNGKPGLIPFVSAAARAGYLVINLSYPDSEPATVCRTDIHCFEGFRRKIWDGTNASNKVDVSPTDSIKNRLIRLIAYLAGQYPNEGWRAYLAGNDLAYSSIAFAGHSQGGGFAAYIAKYYQVARVIMFSSVVDATDGNNPIPAHWVSSGHVTPTNRYYGFDHVSDIFARKIAVDWSALGLDSLGPRTPVDGARPPYGHSHQLTTSVPQPDGHQAHSCVLRGDHPEFLEVWNYMLLH